MCCFGFLDGLRQAWWERRGKVVRCRAYSLLDLWGAWRRCAFLFIFVQMCNEAKGGLQTFVGPWAGTGKDRAVAPFGGLFLRACFRIYEM